MKRIQNFRPSTLAYSKVFKAYGWQPLPDTPTLNQGSVADSGTKTLPWFTYSAIAQLERLHLREKRVLEYGSGSSTFYFLGKSCHVQAIEHNKDWYEWVQCKIDEQGFRNQCRLIHSPTVETYVLSLAAMESFRPDIISIDGAWRSEVARATSKYINHTDSKRIPSIVILDNSDWHSSTYQYLASSLPYLAIDFYGHGPFNKYSWCTSFFVEPNCWRDLVASNSPNGSPKPLSDGITNNWQADCQ
jgi:hypothetical protein